MHRNTLSKMRKNRLILSILGSETRLVASAVAVDVIGDLVALDLTIIVSL